MHLDIRRIPNNSKCKMIWSLSYFIMKNKTILILNFVKMKQEKKTSVWMLFERFVKWYVYLTWNIGPIRILETKWKRSQTFRKYTFSCDGRLQFFAKNASSMRLKLRLRIKVNETESEREWKRMLGMRCISYTERTFQRAITSQRFSLNRRHVAVLAMLFLSLSLTEVVVVAHSSSHHWHLN